MMLKRKDDLILYLGLLFIAIFCYAIWDNWQEQDPTAYLWDSPRYKYHPPVDTTMFQPYQVKGIRTYKYN